MPVVTEDLRALYVRVPAPLADQLDDVSRATGRTKQSLVGAVLARELTDAPGLGSDWSDRADDVMTASVLTLEETAELLRLDTDDVRARIEAGDFPARRFGNEWRCSRAAVLDWLGGSDPVTDRSTGFHRETG